MATTREREAQRRAERVENFERQVAEGSVVIRKMTDEERARFPKPSAQRPARKRRY
jgi:hypothetical protein